MSSSLCVQFNSSSSLDVVFDLQLFAGEKTEEPTSKRLSDARNKGQVAQSQELSGAFIMLAAFFALKVIGPYIYDQMCAFMVHIYTHMQNPVTTESVMELFITIVIVLLKTALPIMLLIMLVGVAISFYQVGFLFTTEPLSFNPDKLNPINGMGRLFSKRSLVELFKSIFKLIIIGTFVYEYLKDEIAQMPKYLFVDLHASLPQVAQIILMMAYKIIGVYLLLAFADYAYQKWQHKEGLKMSKDEVKEEFKQTEGDPKIKGKIRQKQRAMAMQRMMQEVPKADVIITNPTHFAVALQYKKGMQAPKVVAKGQDYVAQKIKQVARDAGVTIVENKPLARTLFATVEIGDVVPQDLYKAVAEVLAYVYRLKHRRYA